ncbi:hypothetical protein OL548_21770 [Lysinibacillus sp. MHQ-1]|nr:hypothetical protein OL548_21770 [Lysinibacillus sp. MHQ-1]
METNYGIARENLKPEEIDYMRGMGLFEIEVKDIETKNHYFFLKWILEMTIHYII